MKLRLGTRASLLAVTQSEHVAEMLRALGHEVELVRIRTTGDVTKGSLTRLGTLGVFAAELRTAILDGRCDFAVHSLKDLPTAPVPGLVVAAVPAREDPHDALCAGGRHLADLPAGARVGTGSPRRVAQLRALRPDLRFVDVRGNVGTRLARVADGDLDAVVLAAAGLRRLGFEEQIDDLLPILPAPGQGALALECRDDDAPVREALAALDDPDVRAAVEAERAVLAGLGGGCAAPIAAHVRDGRLTGGVFAADGSRALHVTRELGLGVAELVVDELLRQGAADVTELDATRPSRLADLHDDEALWRGDGTLAGVQVLLPREDGPLADGIRAAGAEVTCCPLQEPVALPWPGGAAPEADWVVVTSARAVHVLREQGVALPAGARVAAVGGATARALEEAGVVVDLVPEGPSSGATLVEAFPEGSGRVWLPVSALAARTVEDGLRAKGWSVERADVYTMRAVPAPDAVRAAWDAGQFDVVVVTSGSAGAAVTASLGWRDDCRVVAFGQPSGRWLRGHGITPAATAATQDAAGVVAAISKALAKQGPARKG